jgi:hypothetical protein
MLVLKNLICLMGLLSCQNNVEKPINSPKMDNIETAEKGKRLEVNGMTVEWEHRKERVFFTLSAPTEGWIVLGFNDKDDISGTNLIFGRVQSGKVEVADHYTVAAGNHKPTEKLGGSAVFQDVTGEEKAGKTTISFSMPVKAADAYHFDLTEGTKRWFICAFSAEDDFYHHSRMREHREVKL